MTDFITREQYMNDSSNLHHAYFLQFATLASFSFVENSIGLEKLQASKDENLNDVVKWDRGGQSWLWDRTPVNATLIRKAGDTLTRSTFTCVGKAVARKILEDAEKENG